MSRRTLEPLFLERSPLVYVLAQVRFSPILKMRDHIPDFQEIVRLTFPRYEEQTSRTIEIDAEVVQKESRRWVFRNRDSSESAILTQDSLVLETNSYHTFELFTDTLRPLLAGLQAATDVALVERIGLRYVDLIVPGSEETIADYLQPSIVGLRNDELGVVRHIQRFESVGITESGSWVVVKVHQFDDGSILPPDLRAHNLDFSHLDQVEQVTTLLDIDHFMQEQSDFVPENQIDQLWFLHDTTDRVFRASVTSDAIQSWKG